MSIDDCKPEGDSLCGIFSSTRSRKIGTGATTKRVSSTAYYFVNEAGEDLVEVQPMSEEYVPVGHKEFISREELLADYMPEPALWQEKVLPKRREIQKAIARGDKFRSRGESFTAEYEYNKALALDERNVRANFGVGLVYIARGEDEKAQEVFERVVKIDAAFEDEHKHLFNEFGISLRKAELFDEALTYYQRAMELAPEDENLHYNLARAAFGKGDLAQAMVHVKDCLDLAPEHKEALGFKAVLEKKGIA